MPEHRVVSVATADSAQCKKDDPAPPVTTSEQIESTHTAAA